MSGQRLIAANNGARFWGGAEIAQTVLCEGLARRGYDVLFYCNHAAVAEEAAARGVDARIEVSGDVPPGSVRRSLGIAPAGRTPPGLLVGFDEREIAEAIERLLRAPGLRREMGRVGMRIAGERFTLEPMLDRWERALSA